MDLYFAPLEGIGGFLYRNAQAEFFTKADKYFSPFISPMKDRGIRPREKRDVCPENNVGIRLVPQILTNDAEAFLQTAKELWEMGYTEVNLNLGCPSKTVVSKKRGAVFWRIRCCLEKSVARHRLKKTGSVLSQESETLFVLGLCAANGKGRMEPTRTKIARHIRLLREKTPLGRKCKVRLSSNIFV